MSKCNKNEFVFNRIANELSKIAEEIESIPDLSADEISYDDMIRMQQIDFCSQKLRDIAEMVHEFDTINELSEENRIDKLQDLVKLEYVQKLLVANG